MTQLTEGADVVLIRNFSTDRNRRCCHCALRPLHRSVLSLESHSLGRMVLKNIFLWYCSKHCSKKCFSGGMEKWRNKAAAACVVFLLMEMLIVKKTPFIFVERQSVKALVLHPVADFLACGTYQKLSFLCPRKDQGPPSRSKMPSISALSPSVNIRNNNENIRALKEKLCSPDIVLVCLSAIAGQEGAWNYVLDRKLHPAARKDTPCSFWNVALKIITYSSSHRKRFLWHQWKISDFAIRSAGLVVSEVSKYDAVAISATSLLTCAGKGTSLPKGCTGLFKINFWVTRAYWPEERIRQSVAQI